MRYGLTLPIFDRLADPRLLADLAADAEQAGWDGVFLWDHLRYRAPVEATTDPWIALAAMAMRTDRVVLGPMVTPLARRRPQIVARQLVALDYLSNGRITFGVGLGLDSSGGEFAPFGEPAAPKVRAEILDEGLELLSALLSGDEVDYRGDHLTAAGVRFLPTPVQARLPIWIAARWPNQRPLRRAAGFDGAFIIDVTATDLPSALAVIEDSRDGGLEGYEVIVDDVAGADARAWSDAGATWLLTKFDQFSVDAAEVRAVIARGPGA